MIPPASGKQAKEFPWWLAAAATIAVVAAIAIFTSDIYAQVFGTVVQGIGITILVALIAFLLAATIGLGIALMGLSGSIWLRQIARFYVEIMRGIPVLVLLFWIAFAGVPAFVAGWNFVTLPLQQAGYIDALLVREVSLLWRAIIALALSATSSIRSRNPWLPSTRSSGAIQRSSVPISGAPWMPNSLTKRAMSSA